MCCRWNESFQRNSYCCVGRYHLQVLIHCLLFSVNVTTLESEIVTAESVSPLTAINLVSSVLSWLKIEHTTTIPFPYIAIDSWTDI